MLKNSLWLFCSTGALSPTVLWRKTSLCLEAHSSAGLKAPLDPHLSGTSWTGEESWTTVLCCRTSWCESSQPHIAKYKWLCVSQAPGMFFLNTFFKHLLNYRHWCVIFRMKSNNFPELYLRHALIFFLYLLKASVVDINA